MDNNPLVVVALKRLLEPQIGSNKKAKLDNNSLALIRELFKSITSKVASLSSLEKTRAIAQLTKLQSDIKQLIEVIVDLTVQLKNDEQRYKDEIIQTTKRHVKLFQKKDGARKKIATVEVKLEGLKNKRASLVSDKDHLITEVENLAQRVISEQQTRINGALDLIPFYGLIEGIKTGNLLRGLPLYSQIVAIISVAEKNLEHNENRIQLLLVEVDSLSTEIVTCESALTKDQAVLEHVSNEISSLEEQLSSADEKIRTIGRDLTALRNLEGLANAEKRKCESFRFSLEIASELIKIDALKPKEALLVLQIE